MPVAAPLREIFPADRNLARFVMAMSIARNDVEHALNEAESAAEEDRPEFAYLVRITTGHLFEGIEALQRWSNDPEVADFLRGLPEDGLMARKQVNRARDQIGREALEHLRNHTFHYPYPGSAGKIDSATLLGGVMLSLAEKPVNITVLKGPPRRFRLQFADEVANTLAHLKHKPLADDDALREQLGQTRVTAKAFAFLIDSAFVSYCEKYDLHMG